MHMQAAPQSSSTRRPWRALLLAILLGALTTLAIAETSAFFSTPSRAIGGIVERDGDHLQLWVLSLGWRTGSRVIWFEKGRIYSKPGVGPPGGSSAAVSNWSFATRTRSDPHYTKGSVDLPADVRARIDDAPAKVIDGKTVGIWGEAVDRRGWPWPAMEARIVGSMDSTSTDIYRAEVGLLLGNESITLPGLPAQRSGDSLADTRVLPSRPLWRGFALDALSMAVGWWFVLRLLGAAWSFVLERRRRRMGCCKKCGYDLAGLDSSVCPECGAPVGTTSPEPPSLPEKTTGVEL